MILDDFFKFPCVMVDGDNEMSKKTLYSGSGNEPVLDVVIGEAECPYFALIGLSDKWMPDEESFNNALEHREFNACLVTIANIGQYLVPWNKEKFKKEYRKFVESVKAKEPKTTQVLLLTEEQMKQLENEQGSAGTTG